MTESRDEILRRELREGDALQRFKSSITGQYIYDRAAEERQNELDRFAQTDPEDAGAIKAIHTRVRIIEKAVEWIESGIKIGQDAEAILLGEEVVQE